MHGWDRKRILAAHPDMLRLAALNDFIEWDHEWRLRDRLRYRLMFAFDAFLRTLARAYGYIP